LPREMLPDKLTQALRRQRYQFVGKHSAVKKCRWLHESLVNGRVCYKQKFYGINSHRCLQMTPSLVNCTMRCVFCWRVQPDDIGVQWNETKMGLWDNPEFIVEECLRAQQKILSGYNAQEFLDKKKYVEAQSPKHVAISLAGEPTLYPHLGDLVHEFHKREMTTFIVSNGTLPEALEKLDEEPEQLYVSVCAPDEDTFRTVCRPQIPDAWSKLNKTLELLKSFSCPTVIRLTLVKQKNMKNVEKYAKLIEKANPTYVEPKGFVFVGLSRLRLSFDNMPLYIEVHEFAEKLSKLTGYKLLDGCMESRVVLLSRLKKAIKIQP